jgi:hypothetical protein
MQMNICTTKATRANIQATMGTKDMATKITTGIQKNILHLPMLRYLSHRLTFRGEKTSLIKKELVELKRDCFQVNLLKTPKAHRRQEQ